MPAAAKLQIAVLGEKVLKHHTQQFRIAVSSQARRNDPVHEPIGILSLEFCGYRLRQSTEIDNLHLQFHPRHVRQGQQRLDDFLHALATAP